MFCFSNRCQPIVAQLPKKAFSDRLGTTYPSIRLRHSDKQNKLKANKFCYKSYFFRRKIVLPQKTWGGGGEHLILCPPPSKSWGGGEHLILCPPPSKSWGGGGNLILCPPPSKSWGGGGVTPPGISAHALTPFKSKFVSFKFPKKFAKRSFNLDAVQTGGEFECYRRVF